MIYVKVETHRVYSQDESGMPLIEKIVQTFEDGSNFDKFLKYLPFQRYLNNKLKIVSVFEKKGDEKKELDKSEWEEKLKLVVASLGKTEKTVQEKNEDLIKQNEDLIKRLESLEARFEQKPQELEVEKLDDIEQLKVEYEEKFGKKPHHLWKEETIKEKLGK